MAPISPDGELPVLRRSLDAQVKDAASVSVLLPVNSVDSVQLTAFLDSLLSQSLAKAVDLVVAAGPALGARRSVLAGVLESRFAGRYAIVDVDDERPAVLLNAAAGSAGGHRYLVADPATVLHDPRSLEALYVMGLNDRVATAGCLMVREEAFKKGSEVRFQNGGIFPSHISLHGAPHLMFTEPYTLSVFPNATYPVAGNSFLLALVNPGAWKSVRGLDEGHYAYHRHDLDFCTRALHAGYTHLCTAAVSASCLRDGAAQKFIDSLSARLIGPQSWQDILSRVTVLYDIGA
jgi:hypothetical protein